MRICNIFFYCCTKALLGPRPPQMSRSHTDTPHFVGFHELRDQLVTETSTDVTVWFYYCDIHILIDSSYCILPSYVRCEVVTESKYAKIYMCVCCVYVCLHLGVHCYNSSVHPSKYWASTRTSIRSWLLPSRSLPIHYFLIILPFSTTRIVTECTIKKKPTQKRGACS